MRLEEFRTECNEIFFANKLLELIKHMCSNRDIPEFADKFEENV